MAAAASAQQVRLYGRAVRGGKPEPGVMIMVFEGNKFYKKLVTDKKGEFRFSVGDKEYTILFYKPGMLPQAYKIVNKMDEDVLKIPIEMEMERTDESTDSLLANSKILSRTNPEVARAYITAIYEYDRRRASRHDTVSIATRRALVRKAVAERNRFATYRKTTARSNTKDSTEKTTIIIGPDTYDMLVDATGAKKYYKNQKPVTETTYLFETTRRYEGVLKNKSDVRRFEKYHPMEHVKEQRRIPQRE